jgi:hypothetical protein
VITRVHHRLAVSLVERGNRLADVLSHAFGEPISIDTSRLQVVPF